MPKSVQIVFTTLGFCLFVLAVQMRAHTVEVHHKVTSDEERFYLPPAHWLEVFTLGYTEAVADAIWIKTIVYFGALADSGWVASNNYVVNYISTAAQLDPKFRGLYHTGGKLTLYQRGAITKDTALMAIEILEKGHQNFPDDGEISFALGFMHHYELTNVLDEEKDAKLVAKHRALGIRYLRRAAFSKGAPRYASLLSSTLLTKTGLENLAIEHLRALLFTETDPTIRLSLEAQLRRLWGDAAERDIVVAQRTHEKWLSSMPYIDFDLYLLLSRYPDDDTTEVIDPLFMPNNSLGLVADNFNG